MSFHNNPKYQAPELIQALKDHGLEHDTPSQLSDAFRMGWVARPPAGVVAEAVEVDEVDFVDFVHPEFGPGYFCTPDVFDDLFAATRAPVAVGVEPEKPGWMHYSSRVAKLIVDENGHHLRDRQFAIIDMQRGNAFVMPRGEYDLYAFPAGQEPVQFATPPAAAGGSVGASREQDSFHVANAETQGVQGVGPVGFVARHADRSKTDTTTSVADSSRVQASNARVYTDAQLAAGVEALGICRDMGIPLSDETVAGIVYDYMTAAGPKRPLTIYMDEDPIDEKLPATPTMTGQEIRDCGWKKQHEYQMFIDHGNTGVPFEPIGTTRAIVLVDGMRFISIPPATW
jgi:hypothetical protein